MIQIAFMRFAHRETESLCAENFGLKDIARSHRGGTNFPRGTNNVLQYMRETESLCAENIGLKDNARSRRGETNFSRGTN